MARTTTIHTLHRPKNSRHFAQRAEAEYHAAMAAKDYRAREEARAKPNPWVYCPTAKKKISLKSCLARQADRHVLPIIDEQCGACPRGQLHDGGSNER